MTARADKIAICPLVDTPPNVRERDDDVRAAAPRRLSSVRYLASRNPLTNGGYRATDLGGGLASVTHRVDRREGVTAPRYVESLRQVP